MSEQKLYTQAEVDAIRMDAWAMGRNAALDDVATNLGKAQAILDRHGESDKVLITIKVLTIAAHGIRVLSNPCLTIEACCS